MHSVKITLALGLAIIAAAIGMVLSESPPRVLATNSVSARETLAISPVSSVAACQANERLPRGTTAIRLSLSVFTGPRVTVKVLSGTQVVTAGEHGSAWGGQDVTVPVKTASHTISPVKICFTTVPLHEEMVVRGSRTAEASAARTSRGRALAGRVKIDYLGGGHSSWLSLASTVARHMGLGRAWSGTWVVLVVAMLVLAIVAVTSRLILRELDE
jgi:hypothetical protein